MASLKKALGILSADFLGESIHSVRSAARKVGLPAPISVEALIKSVPDFAPGTILTQDIINARNIAFTKYIALGGAQGSLGRIPGPILVLEDGRNVVLKCEHGFVVSTDVGQGWASGGSGGNVPTRQYRLTLEKISCGNKAKRSTVGNEANHIWMRLILTSTMQENGTQSSPLIYNIQDMTFDNLTERPVNLPLYSGELPFQFNLSLLGIETYDSENAHLALVSFQQQAIQGSNLPLYDLGGGGVTDAQLVKCLTDALKAGGVIETLFGLGPVSLFPLGALLAWIVDAATGGGQPVVVAKTSFTYNGEAFSQIDQFDHTEGASEMDEEIENMPDFFLLWRRFRLSTVGTATDILETHGYHARKDYPFGSSYELTFRHHFE